MSSLVKFFGPSENQDFMLASINKDYTIVSNTFTQMDVDDVTYIICKTAYASMYKIYTYVCHEFSNCFKH